VLVPNPDLNELTINSKNDLSGRAIKIVDGMGRMSMPSYTEKKTNINTLYSTT
jgi:hypothetical protein